MGGRNRQLERGGREDAPTPHRARKRRRRWCRGRPGVEHQPEVVLSQIGTWRQTRHGARVVCGWAEKHRWRTTPDGRVWAGIGQWRWECLHEERCSACGKILEYPAPARRCPDYVVRTPADTTRSA